MKILLYIRILFFTSLFLCQLGCLTCFSASATEHHLKTFHNVSVLPHTGQMQYNVELYRIKDADFDLPVSIIYTSDGFRPFDYSDPVGSGWTLNAGGVIIRQIMGEPDDQNVDTYFNTSYGFYALLNSHVATPSSADEMLIGTDGGYRQNDCQSDIYTFSFAGYSGSFVIDWTGKAVLLSGDFVEVDLSGMTLQNHIYNPSIVPFHDIPGTSSVKITTSDGYRYTFGNNLGALAYTYVTDMYIPYSSSNVSLRPVITAWYLTSIKAPNGREVLFHYTPVTSGDAINLFCKDIEYTAYCHRASFESAPFYTNTLNYYALTHSMDLPYIMSYHKETWTRTPRLDSITVSEGMLKAKFGYTTLSHAIYETEKYGNRQKSFLTSLQITADKKDVGNWQFTYDKTGNESISHWYLTQLQGAEKIRYRFQYGLAEVSDIAKMNNIDSIDLYGYSVSHPAYGLLRQSHEPTGSITTYTYTPCKYDSLRIFKKTGDRILSVLIPNNERQMFHAQSISSIKVTDAVEQLLLHKYYIYDDAPYIVEGMQMAQAAPNGIVPPSVISIPAYNLYGVLNIDYALINDTADIYVNGKTYTLYPVLRLHSPYFTPLEYGKVVEKVQYGNGQNPSVTRIYYYDNTIDLYEYKGTIDLNHFTDVFPYLLQWERRGNLLHKQEYIGNTKQLKHELYYDYTQYPLTQPKSDSLTQYIPRPPFRFTAMRVGTCNIIIPIVPPVLLSTEDYDIETNGTLQQSVLYQRDTLQRIVREDKEDGHRHSFVRYTYADNLQFGVDMFSDQHVAGYAGLVRQHRIGSPVETVSGFVRDGKEYITHGEITLYKKYGVGGTIVPPYNPPDLSDSIAYGMEGTIVSSAPGIVDSAWYAPVATLSLQTAEPIADYVSLSVQNGKVCVDSHYDTLAVYQYNSRLRMTEVVPQNGVPVRYQWDKQGLYCIAEISGGQQHSYTYYPYVGIATETDPRGVTTYYVYDSLGRLTEVWRMVDGKKQIINAWNYHYANE